jgi:hypothetical protein
VCLKHFISLPRELMPLQAKGSVSYICEICVICGSSFSPDFRVWRIGSVAFDHTGVRNVVVKRAPLGIESDHEVADVHGEIAEHFCKKTNGRSAVGEPGKIRTHDPHPEKKLSRGTAKTSDEINFIGETEDQTDEDEGALDRQKGA